MKNKKKILISLGILIVIILMIGVSYALWSINIAQLGVNNITSDCFKLEFTDKNVISLTSSYPMTDNEASKLTPYTFTITNVCNGNALFQINLETMNPSGNKLPDKYIKADLSEKGKSLITTKLDKTINNELEATTTIEGAVDAYKLLTGELKSGETKEYDLRLWVHSDVTAYDEDSMNASYRGKISIVASYSPNLNNDNNNNNNVLMVRDDFKDGFWNYSYQITKVVFEDKINPKETDLVWDVSVAQDGRAMAYLDLDEGVLYIQGDGGVSANSDSSHFFSHFTMLQNLEGLEYFDTSKVVNMSYMFYDCENLINLDLNSFDTSNVVNMSYMFNSCYSLKNLRLSSFNTSNVTSMTNMFGECYELDNLDLSNFNTSNVTDMAFMFFYIGAGSSNVTNLDLSSFDTSSVTDMRDMFEGCYNLENLDLSNFNTSNVTNMSYMFSECEILTSLDISSFEINNVTNVSYMFNGLPDETTIYVKNNEIQNWILNESNARPSSWTERNVIVKA